jgi:hypothetical protein
MSVEEKNYTLIHQLVEADILVSRTVISMDIKLNRLINGKYRLPCFALLVFLAATTEIKFEVQALVAGPKQSSQADKADRLTRQRG